MNRNSVTTFSYSLVMLVWKLIFIFIFLGFLTRFVINSKNQCDAIVVVKARSKQQIRNVLWEIFPWLVVLGNRLGIEPFWFGIFMITIWNGISVVLWNGKTGFRMPEYLLLFVFFKKKKQHFSHSALGIQLFISHFYSFLVCRRLILYFIVIFLKNVNLKYLNLKLVFFFMFYCFLC